MVERVYCEIDRGADGLRGAIGRYALLQRCAGSADRCGLQVLAFGLGHDELRLVVEGPSRGVGQLLKSVKNGTIRQAMSWGFQVRFAPTVRIPVGPGELDRAVAWAHRAPVEAGAAGPLASPWSSHRDLMGYRIAEFFAPDALVGRVDPLRVHELAGGKGVPEGWPPSSARREPLGLLLRVSAAVLGVLPADRRCFRLFVHLGRARGWESRYLADALALSTRRVRQLATEVEPALELALRSLGDPRLRLVP